MKIEIKTCKTSVRQLANFGIRYNAAQSYEDMGRPGNIQTELNQEYQSPPSSPVSRFYKPHGTPGNTRCTQQQLGERLFLNKLAYTLCSLPHKS